MTIDNWLDEYRNKHQTALDGISASAPPGDLDAPVISEWPAAWPDRFVTLATTLGLRRYLRELAELVSGKLSVNDFYTDALAAWALRAEPRHGLILFGGEGAGKSVTALSICLEVSKANKGWDYLDAGEFADLWALQDRTRIGELKSVGLLVIDEIGDCEDIKGAAFGLMKRTINNRYRDDMPTILATTQNNRDLRAAISSEVVDRFPEALRIRTSEGSYRV